MGWRSLGAPSTVTTARSVDGSVPWIVALNARPSERVTVSSLAPETTWLLVRTWPESSMMTPEPSPLSVLMATTLGDTAAAVAVQFGDWGSVCETGAVDAPRPKLEEEDAEEGVCASCDPSWVAAYVPPEAR